MSERRPQATIPEPYENLASLRSVAVATKELVEVLAGQRGSHDDHAVTFRELPVFKDTMLGNFTVNGTLSVGGALSCGSFSTGGSFVVYQTPDYIGNPDGGSIMVQASTNYHVFITYHIAGQFAANLGMSSDGNFYVGGWSFGNGTYYTVWTSRHFANPACDYRIKENIEPLPSMWDKVKALNPISYTIKEFSLERQGGIPALAEGTTQVDPAPTVEADPRPRWGLIAHELQETLLETAANGVKDDPTLIQSPTALPIIAALVKCLQEAMARIEVLEARVG